MEKQEIERLIEEKVKKIISQSSIFPESIKSRHVGEGVRYIRAGTAANRPTSGEKAGAIYFATDTFDLSVWTGSAWKTEALT